MAANVPAVAKLILNSYALITLTLMVERIDVKSALEERIGEVFICIGYFDDRDGRQDFKCFA
jgi:hypothetical protein